MRTPGNNILQENLFVILSSCEMMALSRVCSIIHIAVCLPLRWLAGNSHKLKRYDWSVRSMGKCIDLLEKALELITDNGSYILDEYFMMGIFNTLHEQLPPFSDYITHMFENKKMGVISNKNTKVVLLISCEKSCFCMSLNQKNKGLK